MNHDRYNLAQKLTLRHSSFGKKVKGSFFSRGLTNSWTNASCWLLHIFRSSASNLSFSASFISMNRVRTSRTLASSCSAAVLQSGAFDVGVGLGAGVGGDVGADGSIPWDIVTSIEPAEVWIGRGWARWREFRFLALVTPVNVVGLQKALPGMGETSCGSSKALCADLSSVSYSLLL